MNVPLASPATVDFGAVAGQIFSRQPQLRAGWNTPLGGGMGTLVFEGSIEKASVGGRPLVFGGLAASNPGSTAVDETQGEGQSGPIVVGKVSWRHPIFQVEAAGAVGENTVILAGGKDESDGSWGVQVSAQATFAPVTLKAHYQMLKGLGRLATLDFPDVGLTSAAGKVENIEVQGGYVSASLALTPETSINGVLGFAKADENTAIGFTGTELEKHRTLHVNIIHRFWKSWQAGLEYKRVDVEAFNGTEGDVNIVLGALWYFF